LGNIFPPNAPSNQRISKIIIIVHNMILPVYQGIKAATTKAKPKFIKSIGTFLGTPNAFKTKQISAIIKKTIERLSFIFYLLS
jgi:hypothetical protein